MCLEIAVTAPSGTLVALERIAALRDFEGLRLTMEPPHPLHGRCPDRVKGTISGEGGCACNLLADDADWDAPVWAMRPEVLSPLARILEAVGSATSEEWSVQAVWIGMTPQEQRVSVAELVAIVDASQLGTLTRYTVPPSR